MSGVNEDDKVTVVLDLNALKKQKLKQEDDLANLASELEFNLPPIEEDEGQVEPPAEDEKEEASEDFAVEFLVQRQHTEQELPQVKPVASNVAVTPPGSFTVILFDFTSDFFLKSKALFPKGFTYKIIKTLPELNQCLKSKNFQIVVFNYDGNPKAINQLSAQIKQKIPSTKTIIMAKTISPEKAKAHAKTPSGATGYYQYPLEPSKIEKEFKKIYGLVKKVS